ncbi:MAG TPA: PEP-CTERM sorting domain-containing protein [Phycisphaerae bacterium]|nr:PEP-CTERM sorting domain-containing protein [Phycisphaerae bacterium]
MRYASIAIGLFVVSLGLSAASADTIHTFSPSPRDLYDLDHSRYYTWGIDRTWEANDVVVGATLTFYNIRNWDDNPNVLYVNLLDYAPLGVRSYWDGEDPNNAFEGQGAELVTYVDLPSTSQTLTHQFTPAQLVAMNEYDDGGRFALAFDPDCHFYNCGVSLEVITASTPVPEPSSLALIAIGAGGLILRRFRRR